jgi:Cys-tRNA(Pro) deacylase
MQPFKAVSYASVQPGTRLIVLGAVHGNETCGTQAIARVVSEIDAGTLRLAAGQLTLVPVANPLAYTEHRRAGDRNLNRQLAPTATPNTYEDHVANWLCPLLAAHEVLLDLHSFQSPGTPFVMVGPADNDGPLEPFTQATREEALAVRLGVDRAVDGWLDTYAVGVARRRELAAAFPEATLDLDPRYGVGTTEYMRSTGGYALTLECGQHTDPEAPAVAYRAIVNTLAHLRLIDATDPPRVPRLEGLRLCEVIDRLHPHDTFAQAWRSFDPVAKGQAIGTRHGGSAVVAPFDGYVVFPNAAAEPGHEWFYLAKPNSRLTRDVLPEHLAEFIARNRIDVEVVNTEEAAATAGDVARILGVHVSDIVKTMVLTDGARYVASIVPGDKRLDRKKVARAIGSGSLRFASAREVVEYTGYPPGGVAPFGFATPVTVVVDESLSRGPGREVVAGGGRPELLVRISVVDLIQHTQALVAPIAQDDE